MTNEQYPMTNEAGPPRIGYWSLVIGHWLFAPVVLSIGVGVVLAAATGLSPLAAADRPALALFAVCVCLPLGAALGALAPLSPRETFNQDESAKVAPDALRRQGNRAIGALICGALLALLTTGPDPSLFARTASWCAAGCLMGAMLARMMPGAGTLLTLGWLGLCGLPFFCDKLGSFSETATQYALQGCPWLGFSQDAIGGDPLRMSVIYLGQWSPLADLPAVGLLTSAQLWGAAALALAAALLRTVAPGQSRA